jgi:hypothetical protein
MDICCDTLAESLQPKKGHSCELYSCMTRCEACALKKDYEVNASRRASIGRRGSVVLDQQEYREARRARAQGIVVRRTD